MMKEEEKKAVYIEAEYHRMRDENEVLKAKLDMLHSEYRALETEFGKMRAQLDIVYLIFGRK